MALLKAKKNSIPGDAVILSENDALKYQLNILKNWKHSGDIWPIKYGSTILASFAAFAGIYMNNYYRMKLKLFHYGQVASYLPICIMPALTSYLLHIEYVTPDIVLQKSCAVCIEMRASAIQAGMGCVFPAVLAPLASYSLALKYNTYSIPYLNEPFKLLQFWRKQTKPISNILFFIFVGQALLASATTYLEAKSIEKVNDKLTLFGYELEELID